MIRCKDCINTVSCDGIGYDGFCEKGQRELNGITNKEIINKYRWHDLRKNPNDLPKNEEIVRIACERYDKKGFFTLDAFYEDGSVHSEESDFSFTELDEWAEYCEETDDYIIPEGWLEYVMFAECFGAVDCEVIAWKENGPFEEVEE